VRRALGVLVVAGVVVIALGWDTRFLAQFSTATTAATEQQLIERLGQRPDSTASAETRIAPPMTGATHWLNSAPLNDAMLRGKVVLVDFWTYSCINCLRTLPYLKAWDERYRAQGLVIIGVHSPEFSFEKTGQRRTAIATGIRTPVALDNLSLWRISERYWPAHYLIDGKAGFSPISAGNTTSREQHPLPARPERAGRDHQSKARRSRGQTPETPRPRQADSFAARSVMRDAGAATASPPARGAWALSGTAWWNAKRSSRAGRAQRCLNFKARKVFTVLARPVASRCVSRLLNSEAMKQCGQVRRRALP
jgi:thiol-disulfide isomerase/thioredoxin